MSVNRRYLALGALFLVNITSRSDMIFGYRLMDFFPVFFVLFLGSLVAFIVNFFNLRLHREIKPFWEFMKKYSLYLWVNSVLATILAPMLFLLAIKHSSAINASFFVAFTPLFVTILAYFFLNEKNLSTQFFLGFIFMFLGASFIITKGFKEWFSFNYFDFFALIASFVYGLSDVYVKKYIPLKHLDLLVTGRLLCAVLALLLVNLLISANYGITFTKIFALYDYILGYALITISLTYFLFYYGLRYIPAHEASMLILFEPLVGGVIAFLYLGEVLQSAHIYGGFLLLIGLFIFNSHFRKNIDLATFKMKQKSHHS